MNRRGLRLVLWACAALLFGLALNAFYRDVILMGNPPSLGSKRLLLFLFAGLPLALLLALIGLSAAWRGEWPRWITRGQTALLRLPRILRLGLAGLILLLPAWLFNFSGFGLQPSGYWLRLGALLAAALLASLLQWRIQNLAGWLARYAVLVAAAGALYALADTFTRVSGYPFSLGWSEGNRLWDYSVLFGSARYLHPPGQPIFAFISPGRQLVWALPFLIPDITIWAVRFWDALMWVLPALLLGWLAFRLPAAAPRARLWQACFAVWTFLFLSQGPIYAPLVLAAVLVVLALRTRRLGWALLLVVAAAYYANLSRWTWTYAPGLWAGLLALLDIPSPTLRRAGWRSLVRPLALGLAGYAGGQFLPALVDLLRGTAEQATLGVLIDPSSVLTRQPLLWYRLLPNATFAPGILLGTLWAGLPLVVFLILLALRRKWQINLLQAAATTLISLVFLVIGLVASTKIGGGSNLHNLDMLWVTLTLIAAWALKNPFPRLQTGGWLRGGLAFSLVIALLFPAAYAALFGGALEIPTRQETADALNGLQTAVREYASRGEVLFLDQRQLLTFGEVPQVPLVVEYEKKYLMEQALRGNSAFFQDFYRDLAAKRFAMMVSEPLQSRLQDEGEQFGEENDAWVRFVSIPVKCYYEELTTFSAVGVQLLVPRSQAQPDCPLPASQSK